jgi:hypothetical protein
MTGLRVGRTTFSPDGKYPIAAVGDLAPVGAPPALPTNVRTALWKIGSGNEPIREWGNEQFEPGGLGDFPLRSRKFAFSADGKTCSDYRFGSAGATVETYDLETGKVVQTRMLLNADSAPDNYSFAGSARNRSFVVATDAQRGWVAMPSATGVAVRRLVAPTGRASAADAVEYESLDGPPQLVAFRPDGSLVTLHPGSDPLFDGEATPTSKLRIWPKVPSTAPDVTTAAVSMPPVMFNDRTRAAFLIVERRPVTLPRIQVQSKPLRLVVADHTGAKLLDVPSTDRQPLSPIDVDQEDVIRATPRRMVRFSADGRYIIYCVRTPSRSDPPDAAEAFDTVVIYNLENKQEVTRLRQEPGLELLNVLPSFDGSRLLVATGVRLPPKDTGPFGLTVQADAQVRSARLYDFPSGPQIAELKLPADKTLAGFRTTRQGWQGFKDRGFPPDEEVLPHWETKTGDYLGELKGEPARALPPGSRLPARREVGDRVEHGGRVLRRIQTADETGRRTRMTVEVWDAAHQGDGDRPLLTIEERTFQAYLSPDGKRLLVAEAGQPGRGSGSCMLYCTDTGRPVLSLPDLRTMRALGIGSFSSFDPVGFWSADGRQFWADMDPNGNLFGYDFRPRER